MKAQSIHERAYIRLLIAEQLITSVQEMGRQDPLLDQLALELSSADGNLTSMIDPLEGGRFSTLLLSRAESLREFAELLGREVVKL